MPEATPWISQQDRATKGWAALCAKTDSFCLQAVERLASDATGVIRITYEHSASFFGLPHPPVSFLIVLAPPSDRQRTFRQKENPAARRSAG
jgi:hypothetical protein